MSADFRPRGRVRMTDGSIHGVASALPPASSIGNTRWWHARFCADCAPVEYAEQVSR